MDTKDKEIRLREATEEDSILLYKWAIDPSVRENSLNKGTFSYEDHIAWFMKRLNSSDCLFYILEKEVPLGQIRLDKTSNGWLINFSIAPEQRGKGYGADIVRLAIKKSSKDRYIAYVIKGNTASEAIFRKNGFSEVNESDIENTCKFILKTATRNKQ